MSAAVRVLLGDDHKIVREGLKMVLADDSAIQVVAEAGCGLESGIRVMERFEEQAVRLDRASRVNQGAIFRFFMDFPPAELRGPWLEQWVDRSVGGCVVQPGCRS